MRLRSYEENAEDEEVMQEEDEEEDEEEVEEVAEEEEEGMECSGSVAYHSQYITTTIL